MRGGKTGDMDGAGGFGSGQRGALRGGLGRKRGACLMGVFERGN